MENVQKSSSSELESIAQVIKKNKSKLALNETFMERAEYFDWQSMKEPPIWHRSGKPQFAVFHASLPEKL
jgi:hypothetical protein